MLHLLRTSGQAICLLLVLTLTVSGEETGEDAGAEAKAPPRENPFANESMLPEEEPQEPEKEELRFQRREVRSVPNVEMLGYVRDARDERVVLLQVAGHGRFFVREEDTLTLQARGDATVLKIKTVSDQSVVVEIGTLGKVIVVR